MLKRVLGAQCMSQGTVGTGSSRVASSLPSHVDVFLLRAMAFFDIFVDNRGPASTAYEVGVPDSINIRLRLAPAFEQRKAAVVEY